MQFILSGYTFDKIREEAKNRKLDYEFVLIERAPVCKSIFVKGIPEDTPQETIEKYFDKFGVVEKLVSNTTEVKANKAKEQRAILYFKKEKSKIFFNFFILTSFLLFYKHVGEVKAGDRDSVSREKAEVRPRPKRQTFPETNQTLIWVDLY